MKSKHPISLIVALIFLNNFSLEASFSEKCAEWCFKKAAGNIKKASELNDFHSFTLSAHTVSKVTLGISGFACATSLLLTYKKILSEGKSGEWKGTKITAGIIITTTSGIVVGGSYLVKEASAKVMQWTNSQYNFLKKCVALKLQNPF